MDDEDFTVTTREIVARAYQTGRALCDFGFPHPTRIVPDGFGGVSFQWDGKSVPIHVSFVVTPDSQLETKIFVNCKLKLSATMPLDDLLVVLSNA